MSFKKFTTHYDDVQDRIRVAGETVDGDVVSLWLTARLLQRLVPALARLISQESSAHTREGSLQTWQQSTANAALGAQVPGARVDPVQAQQVGKHTARLIHSVDIEATAKQAVMVFRVQDSHEVARLPLSPLELRQWLGILYRKCQRAGWSLQDWPAWLGEAEKEGVHHHQAGVRVH